MLRNYFKTAIRSLMRQTVYTSINVIGLAVSITACLLIVLYVKHELSYDNFFPGADRIYKLALERKYPNHTTFYASVPHSYTKAIQQDFPEVEKTLQLFGPNQNSVITYKAGEGDLKSFEEDYFLFADSSFFNFFDIALFTGDKKTALSKPAQVIISESAARKIFGKEDALGKILGGDFQDLKVTGVFKDLPDNSHLKLDFVASVAGPQFQQFINRENYTGFDAHIYLKLKPGADYKNLEAKFPKMVDTYAAAQIERNLGKSWQDYKKAGNGYRYFLQPLTSIHLDSRNIESTITPSGNVKYVYILSFIALLILVIACINFMNLATARSAERAREVGVRKVMGSLRGQLITQFLIEATLLALVSTFIALTFVFSLLPYFNNLVEKQLHFVFSFDVILGLLGFAVLVGILAGFYPAFALSSFNPVIVMKGNFTGGSKGSWLRNGLVVFQFFISIVLIVGTVVIGRQMKYMQDKDLGFDKDQMLMIQRAFVLDKNTNTFIEELKRMPEVIDAASTSSKLGDRNEFFGQFFQAEGSSEILTVKSMVGDDEFTDLMGLKLKEGKSFARETNDSLNVILNETAIKTLGLADPIGMKLWQVDNNNGNQVNKQVTIIGVVKDFHFQSLRDEITPLVIFNSEQFTGKAKINYIAVRLKAGLFQHAIPGIESKWRLFIPDQPFKFQFLDDSINQGYTDEQRSAKLFAVFSALAIVIACVGLFGLSAYTASLRTKEIGVRKVLGSSVAQVVVLLSKDFTKLVVIAFVMAVPMSWWMMDTWLKGFAYRVDVNVGSFLIAGGLAFGIAVLTVSYQSIKAAIVNPSKSLKSE